MTLEQLFTFCNTTALAAWLLLIAAPRWRWTGRLVRSGAASLLFALVYAVLIVPGLTGAEGGFGTLAEVGKLFEHPTARLAGWVHYLAFDLFVGVWETEDARRAGIRHALVVPSLILTFLAGPAGLLAYLVTRALAARQSPLEVRL